MMVPGTLRIKPSRHMAQEKRSGMLHPIATLLNIPSRSCSCQGSRKVVSSASLMSQILPKIEIAMIYGHFRGIDVPVKSKDDVEDLRRVAMAAMESGTARRYYWEYIEWFYQLFTLDIIWGVEELGR